MNPTNLEAFDVIGVSTITNDRDAMTDIGKLWERAAASGALVGAHAVAVYHRYVVEPGRYTVTVTVGHQANDDERAAPGHDRVSVPSQACVLLETDGSLDAVRDAWKAIWELWPDGGRRAFVADVERWTMGPRGPERADVYVGTK